jgi:hypothetical protein
MTDIHVHRPLSRVELIVLSRLSTATPPTHTDIVNSLARFGIPFAGAALNDCATATLVSLQGGGLATAAPVATSRARLPQLAAHTRTRGKTSTRKAIPRFALTDRGRLVLRNVLGLEETPSWKQMCDRVVPALALGEQPGDEAADVALGSIDAMVATWLRRDRALGGTATVAQLCDRIIAKRLGMPSGLVTPDGIRAFVLAEHCGVDGKAEFERIATMFEPMKAKPTKSARSNASKKPNPLKMLAADLAARQLGVVLKSKQMIARALARHWVSRQDEADAAQWLSASRSTPLQSGHASSRAPAGMSSSAASTAVGDALLTAVRDAIPMVGAAGRYGKENVFVSALWQQLAHDRRLPLLSLDHFKQWLVDANRHQLLALARADLVDDMDAHLVEDSEIEDLGETFHFVVDHRGSLSALGQMHYA